MKKDETSWIAPLVRTLLTTQAIDETVGPMTCPICGCDHQIFQGTGVLCPDKDGTHLVCAFPSTETLAKIDMPPDIKIGGMTLYIRFACACQGHRWVWVIQFHQEMSVAYCADLTPYKNKPKCSCKKGKAKASAPDPTTESIVSPIQQLLSGMKAGGMKPTLLLGPGFTQALPPEAIKQLQEQGAAFLAPKGAKPPKKPTQSAAEAPVAPDHEDPLVRLPATVRYAWQNWGSKKPLPDAEIFNFTMPTLPLAFAAKNQPPHLASGTNDSKLFPVLQEWLLTLAVDVKPETKIAVHSLVYWSDLLIVVTNAAQSARKGIAEDIVNTIVNMKTLKPNIFLMPLKDYRALAKAKAATIKPKV